MSDDDYQLGAIADQSLPTPAEIAAARMRQSVVPIGGRQEGLATVLPESAVMSALRFPSKLGGVVQEYEDPTQGTYRPGPVMEAATSTMGMGGLAAFTPGMRGTIGMAGGRPVQQDNLTGFAPGSVYGRFPQYAETYPAAGPPKILPKDNPSFPGETYEAKELTPQAKEFAKARTKISTEMEQGYTPYFDPEKRFYADPTKYPPANIDTLAVTPKRADTIAEYEKFIDTPETKKLLRDAYKRGDKLGNANDWYAMGQLEKEFIAEYGAKEGRKNFLDRFAVPMAATTSGNNPQANFLMAHYLEYLRGKGEPIPPGHQLPTPVGGRRANVNIRDYESVREKGGYSGLGEGQPKMHNFTRNFIGDLSRATMDEQMATGMLAPQGVSAANIDKARTTGFGMLEAPLRAEAKRMKIQPANLQDVAWAGFKGESSGPMINVINDAIERTHRLTGMPRDEIVRRGIVRKEIPIYGLTGTMGGLAAMDAYQRE